ncbi:MAG TPA: hypothetical protein VK582_10065 [Pyrinomonadaceae bacterium]|nr:hypothetical protein [Pyrinomonadaceae bacterium]
MKRKGLHTCIYSMRFMVSDTEQIVIESKVECNRRAAQLERGVASVRGNIVARYSFRAGAVI